jgi:hypothetical protein
MVIKRDGRPIRIVDLLKAPAPVIRTGKYPRIVLEPSGRGICEWDYDPEVEDAIQAFINNEDFPIKVYCDVYRALRGQLLNAKQAGKKHE